MKKTKLLSLLTAIAAVVTTAVTYAVWDILSDSSSATVSFRNPVTISVNDTYTLTNDQPALNTIPSASGDISFNISDENNLAKSLKLIPKVTGVENCTADDFTFEITDKDDSNKMLTGDSTSGFSDSTLESTNYTIKVTPKDSSSIKIAGKSLNIQLEATLSE